MLPAEPCGNGLIAVPGDDSCRAVANCGSAPWGDIERDADTQHVDGSHDGSSDGSERQPWRTIGEAITAATAGATVAVAEGSYHEEIDLFGKSVRVWARCPELVELVGAGAQVATVTVRQGADGSEVRGLAITNPSFGVAISGSQDVRLRQLWLHDLGATAIDVRDNFGVTSVTVLDTLVERAAIASLGVASTTVVVERSHFRDTAWLSGAGLGAYVQPNDVISNSSRSMLTLRSSVIERQIGAGVLASGGDLVVEASVIRDITPDTQLGAFGRGISVQDDTASGQRASLLLTGSLVTRAFETGVFVGGSDAVIETTVVRDTQPLELYAQRGRGVSVQSNLAELDGSLSIEASVIQGSTETAIAIIDSHASIRSTMIVSIAPAAEGLFGDAVAVVAEATDATASLEGVRIEAAARAGLVSFGGAVTLLGTAFECNVIDLDGEQHGERSYQLDNKGGNACGCDGSDRPCQVLSSQLAPPTAAEP